MVDPAELRELLARATKGPWYADTDESEGEYGSGPDTHTGYDAYLICAEGPGPYHGQQRVLFDSHNSTIGEIEEDRHPDEYGDIGAWDAVAKANAALIVAAVNSLPSLLDEIERLRGALQSIDDLPVLEINPSNYDHDDVCELNDNAVQAGLIARTALQATTDATKEIGDHA